MRLGRMDNVMIFNTALTSEQVYVLYKSATGGCIDYDAAGNLIADRNGYIYHYDYENRIFK